MAKVLPQGWRASSQLLLPALSVGRKPFQKQKASPATLDKSQMPPGAPKIGVPSDQSHGRPFGVMLVCSVSAAGRREGEARKRGSCAAFSHAPSLRRSETRWEPGLLRRDVRRPAKKRHRAAAVPRAVDARPRAARHLRSR